MPSSVQTNGKGRSTAGEIKAIIRDAADENERSALMGEWTLFPLSWSSPILKRWHRYSKGAEMIGGRCRTLTAGEPFVFGLPLMIFFHRTPAALEKEIERFPVRCTCFALTGVKKRRGYAAEG
jgi:LuxR family maltose regulon positive regulatory protein